MDYGKKIANLRKSKGMTQEELGKVLNVTYQAVSKWERGESLPDFATMSQMAKFFQVPLEYFNDGVQTEAAPAATAAVNETEGFVGMCTECGRMLKEDEVYTYTPKILCTACAQRLENEKIETEKAQAEKYERQRAHEIRMQRGSGVDVKLIISLLLAAACYVLFMILSVKYGSTDGGFYGFLLFLVPIVVFGIVQAWANEINEMRITAEDFDGYTRNLSLIVAALFALINLVCFLVLYLMTKEMIYIFLLIGGVVLSFTFISQFMWGGVVQEIFTAGGFTFKLPGFIFSLDIDSILFMIIAKIFLGIIAIAIFLVTTVVIALVAIFGSVFTFIPSVIAKTVKDKKV